MPPAAYTTLREVFLTRVIRIKAVQDERAAAIEESRQPGAPASTDVVERFFEHGILPGRGHLWRISTAELGKAPAKPTALDQARAAAWNAWRQLVHELCNGTMIATGERFNRGQEPWRGADRREIGSETWLNINGDLCFDMGGASTVCRMMDVGFGSRPVPVWFEIRLRGADEAAESEDFEKQPSEEGKSGDKALAPPQPDKTLTKKQIRVLEAMKELIKDKPAAAGLSDEAMSDCLARRMTEKVSSKIVAIVRKLLRTSERPRNFRETSD